MGDELQPRSGQRYVLKALGGDDRAGEGGGGDVPEITDPARKLVVAGSERLRRNQIGLRCPEERGLTVPLVPVAPLARRRQLDAARRTSLPDRIHRVPRYSLNGRRREPSRWVLAPLPLYRYLRVSARTVRCPFGECAPRARISLQSADSLAVREPERLWEIAPSVEPRLEPRLSLLRSCCLLVEADL
jgi:hypothetical protein